MNLVLFESSSNMSGNGCLSGLVGEWRDSSSPNPLASAARSRKFRRQVAGSWLHLLFLNISKRWLAQDTFFSSSAELQWHSLNGKLKQQLHIMISPPVIQTCK